MSKLKKIIGLLLFIALLIIGVVFALLNETAIPLDLFFVITPPIHMSLLIFAAFAIGLLLGMLVTSLTVVKVKVKANRQKRADHNALMAKN